MSNAASASFVRYQSTSPMPAPISAHISNFFVPPTPYLKDKIKIINTAIKSVPVSISDHVPPFESCAKNAITSKTLQINHEARSGLVFNKKISLMYGTAESITKIPEAYPKISCISLLQHIRINAMIKSYE